MVGTNRWRTVAKTLLALGLVVILSLSSDGVGSTAQAALRGRSRIADPSQSAIKSSGKIAEASPPSALQELRQALDDYQPQVTILSPKKNEVLPDNTVSVRFLVKDLPIFKNETFGLGPHLHVLLDNRPYQAVYDLKQPLVLNDLEPGTHTIRAFASRPWHESFKNEGAFAQITFHVLTKTQDNSPDPDQPLLTYSRPQGVYGAEPILLDFYLTNVPLHLVAQADANDDIADWRIRCTVNGDRFVLDRWQPIYLKGFKPGKNWVQLEYLDNNGNPIKNVFNNTVRVVDYQPNGADTLAKLVRGDLSAADVRGIVDPNYVPAPPPSPTPTITLTPTPKPSSSPLEPPQPESAPSLKEPRPDAIAPLSPTPAPTITPTPEPPPEARTPAPSVKPPVTEPLPSPSETVPFAPAFAPSEPVAEPKSEELTLEEQTLEEQTPNEQTVPTEPAAPAPEATKARKPTSSRERKSNATRVRRSTKAAPLSWQERLRQFQERLSRSSAPAPSPSVSTPSVPTPDLPSTLPEIINPSSPEAPFSQPEAPTLDERSSR